MTNGNDLVYPTNDCREGTLTKRELFAAMAMQGMVRNKYMISRCNQFEIAELADQHANALIEQLNK